MTTFQLFLNLSFKKCAMTQW